VGRLHHQKAHDVLLDAFARLGTAFSEWKLAIVGQGGQEEKLRMQAEALGIAGRVVWYGQVKNPFPFYHHAKIFVLPSRHEGTPNALLEAMSSGMAVIISDGSPGPLELVEDGKSGIVVSVNEPVSLSRAIERLAADPDLRATLGRAAKEKAAEYSLPKALRAWERLIGWQTEY
jgi:glycosyltransferase involved in cell wall biosynthesis